jgi:hypothetical protein
VYSRKLSVQTTCRIAKFVVSAALATAILGCGRGLQSVPSSVAPPASPAGPTTPGSPATPQASITQRFGFDIRDPIHYWPAQPFSYWRVWDSAVTWAQINTARGVIDFSLLDQYVALAEQHNTKMIYVLGNTPQWASQDPNHVGTQGLPGATAPPSNMQDWQTFVQQIVTRYKGKIYAYEVWNEVDLNGYWTGSVSQAVQMAQIAYQTIKQIDPPAVVLSPSLVAGNGKDYLKNFFNAGGNNYSDAVAYHLYDPNRTPELIVQPVYQEPLAIAQQYGKTIWDTEVGWGPWGDWSDQDAAAYTARNLILQAAAGIDVIVWYAWDDIGPWVHLYFVRSDRLTQTPAAIAYGQIQAWLLNSTISCTSSPDGSWQCPVVAPDGKQKYIVWNMQGSSTFAVPAAWQVKTVTDLAGNTQAFSGSTLPINTSPVLLMP